VGYWASMNAAGMASRPELRATFASRKVVLLQSRSECEGSAARFESAAVVASGLPGWPDASGLGACGVYLGDVRPVDIALAGAYLAGAGLALAAAEPPAPAGT